MPTTPNPASAIVEETMNDPRQAVRSGARDPSRDPELAWALADREGWSTVPVPSVPVSGAAPRATAAAGLTGVISASSGIPEGLSAILRSPSLRAGRVGVNMRAILKGFTGPSPGILLLAVSGCTALEPFEQKPDPNPVPTTTNPVPTTPPPDCSAYTYDGITYDCTQMDRCSTDKDGDGDYADADDIAYAIACSECNPNYAAPDPTCQPTGTGTGTPPPPPGVETCMQCHNGSNANDYAGPGISNPHGFGTANYLKCTDCHGGDGAGLGKSGSHVPPPPQIGDRFFLTNDATAYFNFLNGSGLDKFPDYTVNGVTYTALDYIQFMNPGDVRLTDAQRGCAGSGCHAQHAVSFSMGFIGNEAGFYSNTMYTIGADAELNGGLYGGSVADIGFRERVDPTWVYDANVIGPVDRVIEAPEYAVYGDTSGFYQNAIYDANNFANFQYNNNAQGHYVSQVVNDSPLHEVVMETVVFQCGDCHAGSGREQPVRRLPLLGLHRLPHGYSLDGRSRSHRRQRAEGRAVQPRRDRGARARPRRVAPDPQRRQAAAQRHVHRAASPTTPASAATRARNRTVLQYWGIRLDQNQDVVNGFQYPANPVTFTTTQNDTRLFDPAVANATFNGRNFNQYLLEEDYDGDQRDDTPADVHYEAGHGLHRLPRLDRPPQHHVEGQRDRGGPEGGHMLSKMDQQVRIQCESCHGTVSDVAESAPCEDYNGNTVECMMDSSGHPLRNTFKDTNGDYWLVSRLDGVRHYLPQIKYAVVQSQKNHPLTNTALYNPNASYAMGVADGQNQNGVGPMQADPNLFGNGFTHMEAEGGALDCQSCHAAWVNACIGCHLQLQYNANPANYFFSNTTGERITVQVTNADFTYIQPNWNMLTVSSRGKITNGQPGMKNFYRYVDLNANTVAGIVFSDRNGMGNNPNYNGAGAFPMGSYNNISSHSIRGAQKADNEGGKECVGCHITANAITNFGADYAVYFDDIENRNYANLDFALLQTHLGLNTNNHLDSPYYVHMTVGLGTGLMATDPVGCPVNPLDANANRFFCNGVAPADVFADAVNTIKFDMDKAVEFAGGTNASLTKPFIENAGQGVGLRSLGNGGFSGPMAPTILEKLAHPATGLFLDSWVDANGNAQGGAANFINN
jgi:hypothetical protein